MVKKIFINMGGIISSRVLGFLRDMATASILGASIYTDLFFIAFKLPNLFRRVFAEGAFTQALLPTLESVSNWGGVAYLIWQRFFKWVFLLSLLVTIGQQLVAQLVAIGYPSHLREMAAPLIALNFWYLDFIFTATFFGALLQRAGRFGIPAFSPALLNLALLGALGVIALFHLPPLPAVYALSIGVLVGGGLQLLLHWWGVVKSGIWEKLREGRSRPFSEKDREGVKRFYSHFFNSVWGSSTAQIASFVDTWLATFLGAGSVSYLYYSNRLFQLPFALFVIATSTVFFPKIARLLNSGRQREGEELLVSTYTYLLPVLGFTTSLTFYSALPIVKLLFERGEFGATDSWITAQLLQFYILGLLPYGIAKLFTSYLYGSHRHKEVALYSTIGVGVNILLSLLLIWKMGVTALPLATTAGGVALLCASYRGLPPRLKRQLALNWRGWGLLGVGVIAGWAGAPLFSALLLWIKGVVG